ncbi:MAG: hypothetical protein IKJ04_07035 [Clostridia bacterium]|nr:hypothetical protein [Clostridia bacterium]
MIRLIIDTILEHAFKMQFLSENDRKSAISDLYSEAEKIYKSDPVSFSKATLMLLNGGSDIIQTDQYRAKMQAAQLWHKNSFDVLVFRIRFFLNINPESDQELLCQKIKAAFAYKSNDFMKTFDARHGYEMLFFEILNSEESREHNLRSALEEILTSDLVRDIDGVIAYVAVNKDIKSIPEYMKTIYLAVNGLSLIEGNGLCGWLIENGISALNDLSRALKKIGLAESSEVLHDLYSQLKGKSNAFRQGNEQINDEIEYAEKQLMSTYSSDTLIAAAEEYFIDNNK